MRGTAGTELSALDDLRPLAGGGGRVNINGATGTRSRNRSVTAWDKITDTCVMGAAVHAADKCREARRQVSSV